jgi:hypothetical protein
MIAFYVGIVVVSIHDQHPLEIMLLAARAELFPLQVAEKGRRTRRTVVTTNVTVRMGRTGQ